MDQSKIDHNDIGLQYMSFDRYLHRFDDALLLARVLILKVCDELFKFLSEAGCIVFLDNSEVAAFRRGIHIGNHACGVCAADLTTDESKQFILAHGFDGCLIHACIFIGRCRDLDRYSSQGVTLTGGQE